MSLRSLWIVSIPQSSQSEIQSRLLFSRVFPTVEKKAKNIEGDNYVQICNIPEFINGLLFELGHREGIDKFIPARDTCRKFEQKPVFEVTTSAGKVWPVVVVEQKGLLFCCVPLVEQGSNTRPPLIQIPSVTMGFSLLCGLADFLRQVPVSEMIHKTSDIYSYLSVAAPFGTPVDAQPESVVAKMYNKPSVLSKTQKQPAWKPVLHKGKNSVYLSITEYIKSAQYEKKSIPDVWDLYGTVACKAELEGAMPDITLNISHITEGNSLPLDHLMIHPCVQTADSAVIIPDETGSVRVAPRRVRFTPPLDMFPLCHYTVSSLQELPVKGSYEMKVDGRTATVSVNLKLSDKVKNVFDYCELQIPFYNRGQISSQDSSVSQGNVMVSPDRRILVWNIGQKFPSKSLSVNLDATVQFNENKLTNVYNDPFCVGLNAYAQLFFKILDFTHSGCYIDPKSVQVSPNTKFKLTIVQEYLSVEYKIWNSQGDALISSVPKGVLEPHSDDIDKEIISDS